MNEKDPRECHKSIKDIVIYHQEEVAFLKQFKVKEILENLNNEFWHKFGNINDISLSSSYENTVYYYSGYQLYFEHANTVKPSQEEIDHEGIHPSEIKSPNIIIGVATEITNNFKKSNFLFAKHGSNQLDLFNINFLEKNSPRGIDERIDINNKGQEEKVLKNLEQRLKDKYSDFMKKEIKNVKYTHI